MQYHAQHFHFIGICGIGMSGIAKILLRQGYKVSGCDKIIDPQRALELQRLGATITHHQSQKCCDHSITTLIISSDIPQNHPELLAAQQRNIPIMPRAAILAKIMAEKTSIAVAGAHGKTTTSSLLSHVLLHAQQDPTIVVGGHLHELNSNAHCGSGKLLVAEADESDRSFLLLPKTYSIVTNIDREHLNTYHDFDDIKQAFMQFINTTPPNGCNILCIDDPGIQSILPNITAPWSSYGISKNADFQIINQDLQANCSSFDLIDTQQQKSLGRFTVSLAGAHNVLNSTAVIITCHRLGIDMQAIKNALGCFQGVDRRFTLKGVSKRHGAIIFDDYGHHPIEIQVTLQTAQLKRKKRIIVVFQPQRFSRTFHLWNEFINVFASAKIDACIITDIFPASETSIEGITAPNLVAAIQQKNPNAPVIYLHFGDDGHEILNHLHAILQPNDLLLFLGAGKVNKLAKDLL